MRIALVLAVAAGCGHHPAGDVDATPSTDSSDAAAALTYGERCGDGVDNDGDGLVDEDCAPSLFAGVFAPNVAADPALGAIEAASGRPLAVVQTYRSTRAEDAGNITPDLAAIFARGQVAHLNVEPAGYTPSQYAAPTVDPIAHDLTATAAAIASALAAAPHGRAIVTFGAEMNGNWTTWGCLPADQYIALYRAAHDAVDTALAAAHVEPRRVRWAYGPNSTSSANCGSAAGYYPGHAYVDLLGMSAYRSGTASVDAAVIQPMAALFDALAYPDAWRHDRFVVLQTGSRAADDRAAWIAGLFATATADDRVAGIIYFDAADWAVDAALLAPPIAAAPVADRGLDGVFAPQFWDVPYTHPAFGEIQALRDAGITTGCATAPARFCPDDVVHASDAAALVARAFPGAQITLADPVMETDLAAAIASVGGDATSAGSIPATRARAAVLLARGARLVPHAF